MFLTLVVLTHKMTELNPDLLENQVIKDHLIGTHKPTGFKVKNAKTFLHIFLLGSQYSETSTE